MDKLRRRLRQQDRGALLIIAERAIEALAAGKRAAVIAGFIRIDQLALDDTGPACSLLEEVREFSRDALAGRYYQSFRVDSRNCAEHSCRRRRPRGGSRCSYASTTSRPPEMTLQPGRTYGAPFGSVLCSV